MIKSNCQVPKYFFFGITVNFIIQKLKFCKIEKEDTLISCQLDIDQVTQQAKETCQRTCRGP